MIDPFDISDVDSWDKTTVLVFLDTWAFILSKHGTHKVHDDLVHLVDRMSEGIEKGVVPVSVGRTFIKSRLADVQEVLGVGSE